MRSIWLIFGCLVLALRGFRFLLPRPAETAVVGGPRVAVPAAVFVSARTASPAPAAPRDSVVRFALRQLGTPYVWAGTSPRTGFDCSGFISYVFGQFGVATPHATALLIDAGRPVPRAQAQPGDIVVFTGTAEGSTTPGHAGIVISALGETPLRFVHASSARRESGVKVSQVENSGYERRFMQVRRVLGSGPAATPASAASQPLAARPAGAVAPLRAAAPMVAADLAVALPARVAPVPLRLRPRVKASRQPAAPKRARLAKHMASKQPVIHKASPKKAVKKKAVKATAKPKSTPHRAKPKAH